ncbi:hypothetical protein FRC03_000552 [Tulasnella sp. 419]|nr:hypothetical protein FRC03_000552 [Tulasnella sp. 419]
MKCDCGRIIDQESRGFKLHIRRCADFKARTKTLHEEAKRTLKEEDAARDRKRQRIEAEHPVLAQSEAQITTDLAQASALEDQDEPTPIVDHIPFVRGLQSAVCSQPLPNQDIQETNGRPRRGFLSRRLPKKYRDILPQGPGPIENAPIPSQPIPHTQPDPLVEPSSIASPPQPADVGPLCYRTTPNSFGIFREYARKPLHNPNEETEVEALTNFPLPQQQKVSRAEIQAAIHPYPNVTTWRIGSWYEETRTGHHLSRAGFADLINNVILAPDFRIDELAGTNGKQLQTVLDQLDEVPAASLPSLPTMLNEATSPSAIPSFKSALGWKKSKVPISIPTNLKVSQREPDTKSEVVVEIEWLHHRCLLSVLKSAMEAPAAKGYHFEPFKTYWNRPATNTSSKFSAMPSSSSIHDTRSNSQNTTANPTSQPDSGTPGNTERVFDELYTSDVWIEEHEKLRSLPPELTEEGKICELPRAICGIMLWSDTTHVAQFGQAKMWPIYLFFGNESKWVRCQNPLSSCHHIGHIPSVSETSSP